jgi:pimeloyl-ACP methyl ester carboxylesterase
MKVLFSLLALIMGIQLATQATWARTEIQLGLVEINHKKLYVEYTKPAAGKPTVILVNGLTYSTRNWIGVAQRLISEGYGVVSYDMYGMGTTLLSNFIPTKPILFSDQAADLRSLLKGLKIKAPYNLAGLSYGGGIIAAFATRYPQDVGNLIMINPYTEFLETQKKWIKDQIKSTRMMFPTNPATDEELTDYFIRQLVYTTYPSAEISSVENPYKLEGITRMVQGIRMYQPIEETRFLPNKSLHLVISLQDQYIPQDIYANYWKAVPARSRANLTYVKFSEHKLPEAFPRFTFQYIKGVVDGQPLLFTGDVLEANPLTMEIKKK